MGRPLDRLAESSDRFLASLQPRLTLRTILVGLLVSSIYLAILAGSTRDAFLNGDAAVYARQIEGRDTAVRTIHLGYYLLGIAFTSVVPGPLSRVMNLMSSFFGALGVLLVFLLGVVFTRRILAGVVAALLLASHYTFVQNSLYAEVYVVQVAFILLTTFLWLRGRVYLSGATFATAVLVTPGSLLALPFLFVLRPRAGAILRMGLTSLVLLAVAILPHSEDYFLGQRGLLTAVARRDFGLGHGLAKEAHEVFLGLFLFLSFIVVGLRESVVRNELRIFAVGLALLWFCTFAIGERYHDVPTQLSTHAMLCIVGGLGFVALLDAVRARGDGRRLSIGILAVGSALLIVLKALEDVVERGGAERLGDEILTPRFVWAMAAAALGTGALLGFVSRGRLGRIGPLVVALALAVSVDLVRIRSHAKIVGDRAEAYRDAVREMSRTAPPDYLVVGNWSPGILFEHYVYGEFYTGRWINTEWLDGLWTENRRVESRRILEEAITARREVWLLHDDPVRFDLLREARYSITPFASIYRARVAGT